MASSVSCPLVASPCLMNNVDLVSQSGDWPRQMPDLPSKINIHTPVEDRDTFVPDTEGKEIYCTPAASWLHRFLALDVAAATILLCLSYEVDPSSPHYGTNTAIVWGVLGGSADAFLQLSAVKKVPASISECKTTWQQSSVGAKGAAIAFGAATGVFTADYMYSLWRRLENTPLPPALALTGACVAPLKPLLALSATPKIAQEVQKKYRHASNWGAVLRHIALDAATVGTIFFVVGLDASNKAILNSADYGVDQCLWDIMLKTAFLLPDAVTKSIFMYASVSGCIQGLQAPKENARQWLTKVFGIVPGCTKNAKAFMQQLARCALPLAFLVTLYFVCATRDDRTYAAHQYTSPNMDNDTQAVLCEHFTDGVGDMNHFATYVLQVVTYVFALDGKVSTAMQVLFSIFICRSCVESSTSNQSEEQVPLIQPPDGTTEDSESKSDSPLQNGAVQSSGTSYGAISNSGTPESPPTSPSSSNIAFDEMSKSI